MGYPIFDGDLTKHVQAKYYPVCITMKALNLKYEIPDMKIVEVVKSDPLLKQKLNEAAGDAVKDAAAEIAKDLKTRDVKIRKDFESDGDMGALEKACEEFQKSYGQDAAVIKDSVDVGLKKVWEEYKKNKTALRNYKIKTVGKVGLSVVGFALGITVAATSAAGNLPGIIAGSITAAKALSKGVQTLRNFAKSAEEVYTEVFKDVNELVAGYKDMGKLQVTGKELFAKALDAFTTKSINSIKQCEAKIATFRTKLSGVDKEAHTAATKLNTLLDAAEDLEKEIKASKVAAFITETKKKLEALEKDINVSIENIVTIGEKVKAGKTGCKVMETKLKDLNAKLVKAIFIPTALVIDAAATGALIWGGAGGADSIQGFLDGSAARTQNVVEGFTNLGNIVTEYVKDMKG